MLSSNLRGCVSRLGGQTRMTMPYLQKGRTTAAATEETVSEEYGRPYEDIPGPISLPFIGTAYRYLPIIGSWPWTDLITSAKMKYKKYGKIVKEEVTPGEVFLQIFDPDDMEKILRAETQTPVRVVFEGVREWKADMGLSPGLFGMNGDDWARTRKSAANLMLRPNIVAKYIDVQSEVADDFIEYLRKKRQPNNDITDMVPNMYRFAMEAVGVALYEKRLGTLDVNADPGSDGERAIVQVVHLLTGAQLTTFFWPFHKKKNTKAYASLAGGMSFFQSLVGRYIWDLKERIDRGEGNPDSILWSMLSDKTVSYAETVSGLIDVMAAAIDTTANSIIYAMYELGKNPDKQQLVYEEINRVAPKGSTITKETLQQIPYLRAVIKETLRMHPVVYFFSRETHKEIVLAGYRIPVGVCVLIQYGVSGRMPEVYEDPDTFKPERWLQKEKAYKNSYAMVPFGHGRRMCVGRRLAEQEMYLVLIKIMQNFRVEYNKKDLGYRTRIGTSPDIPVTMKFCDRDT